MDKLEVDYLESLKSALIDLTQERQDLGGVTITNEDGITYYFLVCKNHPQFFLNYTEVNPFSTADCDSFYNADKWRLIAGTEEEALENFVWLPGYFIKLQPDLSKLILVYKNRIN